MKVKRDSKSAVKFPKDVLNDVIQGGFENEGCLDLSAGSVYN
jgi:hypothetical protein